MGSYDGHDDNQSELDLDFSAFDAPSGEYAPMSWKDDEETLIGSDMEIERHAESTMESDSVDQGIHPSQM